MDIFDFIDNASYKTKCNAIVENKYIAALDINNFWDIYRELNRSDTFLITDKKGNINFFIKLRDPAVIKDLLGSNKTSISVNWNHYGPEILLKNEEIGKIPGFILEPQKNMDAFILQRLFNNKKVFIQYIIQDEKGIIKLLTEKISLDTSFIERLKYYIELDYYEKYPRFIEKDICTGDGYYIKVRGEINLLEEILNIVGRFAVIYSNKTVTVHVEACDFYKIIFFGDIIIIKKTIEEVSNSFKIIEEGKTEFRGKPFFKYIKGLLYFF